MRKLSVRCAAVFVALAGGGGACNAWLGIDDLQVKCIGDEPPCGCAFEDKRCTDNMPQTCDEDGNWNSGVPCKDSEQCSGGVCGARCVPRDVKCVANMVEICNQNSVWELDIACGNYEQCMSGKCEKICTPGSKRCGVAGTPQTCNTSRKWQNKTPCDMLGEICKDGECIPAN
jgi:hypothetical protein